MEYQDRPRFSRELSRKLCIATWFVAIAILGYDIYMPDIIIKGVVIPTVSTHAYYFLAFMVITFAANYNRRKIVEIIKTIAQLKYPGISMPSIPKDKDTGTDNVGNNDNPRYRFKG